MEDGDEERMADGIWWMADGGRMAVMDGGDAALMSAMDGCNACLQWMAVMHGFNGWL
jgi:hypothetical protein